MLRVLIWEFGKLVRLRSVQIGLLAALVLPILWAFARWIWELSIDRGQRWLPLVGRRN